LRKSIVSLFLACTLLLACVPASSQQATSEKNFIMAGFDGDSVQHDWNTNLFFQRMQEKTGISFEFRQFTDFAAWTAEKARLFAGDELPDVLFKAELSSQEVLSYHESGKLIDLAPLLAQNAPNLSALLDQNPEWRKAITLPDGSIPALPAINPIRDQNAMWINKTWLDELKLQMPTDTASLRAVLEAFKTQDPNHNGKADEIPFAFLGPWDLKFLAHAFGLTANDYNVYVDASGKVNFMPGEEKYREFVAWLTELYGGKLLDQSGFITADTMRTVTDENAPATYGMIMGPTPGSFLPVSQRKQFVLLPPLSYNGTQVYRDFVGPIGRGAFAITSACQDPAALLQWVDFLYTEEGGRLAFAGLENTEYAINADNGTWRLLGSPEEVSTISQSATISDRSLPALTPVSFLKEYEDPTAAQTFAAVEELGNIAKLPFPYYTLTGEQDAYIGPMQMDIGRFVDESLARFVIGEVPLTDESWQDYLTKLNDLGLPAFVDFWQQVCDGQAR
jgi:putative aldouronate transport system substrate-binding protein